MSRKYTAQEMREMADFIWRFTTDSHRGYFYIPNGLVFNVDDATAMLRQAADMMEREKKYEYAAQYFRRGKCVGKSAGHYTTLDRAKRNNTFCTSGEELRFVRREVGEWEEVEDED